MNANEFLTLRNAMDRLFQDSFSRVQQGGNGNWGEENIIVPRADAWENEEQVTIELSLPGVNPQDVDITFEQDTLTIQGTFEPLDDDQQWILRERPHGEFRRRFTLQVPVDVNRVEANYRNGLLVLMMPKAEESKPRKIEVKASA